MKSDHYILIGAVFVAIAIPTALLVAVKAILRKSKLTRYEPFVGLGLFLIGLIQGIAFGFANVNLYIFLVACLCVGVLGGGGSSTASPARALQDINSNLSELKQMEQLKNQRDLYRNLNKRLGGD